MALPKQKKTPLKKICILLGADHAGVELKQYIYSRLTREGYTVTDQGSFRKNTSDDYPDVAIKVSRTVAKDSSTRGILICGTGTGMVIAANKIPGIRAAMCYDEYSARMARFDNNTNILTLRGRNFSKEKAWKITKVWLETPFSGKARHTRRLAKISSIE